MEKTVVTNNEHISFKDILLKYNAVVILVVLIIISSILSDAFLTKNNIFNLLRQNSALLLISLGMLLVILTGGIDLSVGSLAAVGTMVMAITIVNWGWTDAAGLLWGIILTLVVGFVLGAITGSLVAFFDMAPFVASLAMMTMAKGLAYLLTNGQPLRLPLETPAAQILGEFGSGGISGIGLPWPVFLSIIGVVIFYLITKYTTFGRLVIATGSNETAVRLAGIEVRTYKFFVYGICGMLSVLAGIIATARASIGTPATGNGMELDAIAACVIGGASLSGGKGTVINTLIGVLILGLITNIMNLLSIPAYPQQIIKGVIIIAAVLMQGITNKKITV